MIKNYFFCLALFIANFSMSSQYQTLYLTRAAYNPNYWKDLSVAWANNSAFNSPGLSFIANAINSQANAVEHSHSLADKIKHAGLTEQFAKSLNQVVFSKRYLCELLQKAKPGNGNSLGQIRVLAELARFASPSGQLQAYFNRVSAEFASMLFDENGRIRTELEGGFFSLFGYDYDHAVDRFSTQVDEWLQLGGYIECAQDTLNNSRVASNSTCLNAIASQKDMQSYNALVDFCKAGKFDDAYAIVQANNHRFIDNHANNIFKLEYVEQFNKVYNSQGIDKKYLDLPYYQNHLKDLPARMVPSQHNALLAQQYALRQDILGSCKLTQVSACAAQVIDTLLQLHRAQGPQAVIDYCATQLSADHPNPEMRATYWDLHNANGSLKFSKPNSQVASFKFSSDIHIAARAQERKLIDQLGSLDSSKFYVQNGVTQTLKYIERSLKQDEFASAYGSLAHRMADALLERGDSQVLGLPDFAIPLTDAAQENIKDRAVAYITGKLSDSPLDAAQNALNKESIEKVADAYALMLNGNEIKQAYLDAALGRPGCQRALEIDTKIFGLPNNQQESAFICSELKRYGDICTDMAVNGAKSELHHIEIAPVLRLYELGRGNDPLAGERYLGNHGDFFIYEQKMRALQKEAQLAAQVMHPTLRKISEFGMQFNVLADAAFKAKNLSVTMKNLASANSIYSFVDKVCASGDRILKGSFEGVVLGAQNVMHMVENPYETAHNFAQGLWNLACAVDRYVMRFSEFSRALVTDPARAESMQQEHAAQIKTAAENAVAFIQEKGLEGCSQEVAQFVTESYLIGKLNGFAKAAGGGTLGEAASTVLDGAKTEAHVAEIIGGATEEVGVKVAQAAENSAFNEAQEVAKQGSKVSEAVASGVENAEAKAAQAIEDAAAKPAKQITKLAVANEKLIAEFNPAHYDPAIMDPQRLSKAVETFKHVEGAMDQCGALKQVLEGAYLGSECTSSLKGAVYELEKALKLNAEGRQVLKLGGKVPRMHPDGKTVLRICEVDIITKEAFIECKNWFWEKVSSDSIVDLKGQLTILKDATSQHGKNLELHSKHSIPQGLKDWLTQKKIIFYEG